MFTVVGSQNETAGEDGLFYSEVEILFAEQPSADFLMLLGSRLSMESFSTAQIASTVYADAHSTDISIILQSSELLNMTAIENSVYTITRKAFEAAKI